MENWKVFLALLLAIVAIFLSTKDLTKKRTYVIELKDNSKPISVKSTIRQPSSQETYNATAEIEKRRENLKKWCRSNKKQKISLAKSFNRLPFLTRYVSKFGVSTGNQTFMACFTPKCASQLG